MGRAEKGSKDGNRQSEENSFQERQTKARLASRYIFLRFAEVIPHIDHRGEITEVVNSASDLLFPEWPFPAPVWLVPLTSVGALVTESALLGNSVEEYVKDVEYGGACLFAVLEPERATALLWFCNHRWNLEDIMGQGGSAVSVETWRLVEHWVEGLH